jgi:hypothetical protein
MHYHFFIFLEHWVINLPLGTLMWTWNEGVHAFLAKEGAIIVFHHVVQPPHSSASTKNSLFYCYFIVFVERRVFPPKPTQRVILGAYENIKKIF